MKISLIAAIGKQNQIGLDNEIPWHDTDDLKRFKYLTLGKTVVMGRKTYESIGQALPGRDNIVISKTRFDIPGACRVTTPQEAIDFAKDIQSTEIMIIGGARVYEQLMDIADRMYLTFINYDGAADTYFPNIFQEEWRLSYKENGGEFKIFDRKGRL